MLIGRLGKDPEIRYTTNGSPIANMRIATDESYTDRDGNQVDHTEWHTVVVFQRQAENCQRYLKKGSLVFVEGSLQTRKWQDPQGQDRYTTEVKAQRIQFLDRKGSQVENGIRADEQHHRDTPSDLDYAFSQKSSEDEHFGRAFAQDASEMDKMPF